MAPITANSYSLPGADPAPELTDACIRPRICRGSGGILPREIWNLGPRKCDFLRSERTLLFQFIYQSHKYFAAFLEKHVNNLNLYRKNNIISPYKKKKFACTSVIAAVAINLY
jgi:hypothetical protein